MLAFTPLQPIHDCFKTQGPTLTTDFIARFEADCIPRIVEAIVRLYPHRLQVEVLPGLRTGWPARVRIQGKGAPELQRFTYPLDVTLAWDGLEVESLFAANGEQRFASYLDALPAKLLAWQEPRQLDWSSLSQADPSVLIGGLDFEH